MKESELISQFSKELKQYRDTNKLSCHFWYKLADVPLNSIAATLKQVLCKRCLRLAQTRTGLFRYQGGKNPFDVLCVIDGIPLAIEFKLHRDHTAFSLDQIKDHQVDALRDFHNAFGLGLILIGVSHEEGKVSWPVPADWFYRGRIKYTVVIPIKQWLWLTDEMRRAQRKSIPLEYFWREETPLCGRLTGARGARGWDIETFLAAVQQLSKEEAEVLVW